MDIHEQWELVKNKIKSEISPSSYETWIEQTTAHPADSDHFVVIAENEFARDWLEHRYKNQLELLLQDISGEKQEICFIVDVNREPFNPNLSKEGRQLQVKYLLDRYESDKKRVKESLASGKTLEEICLEMNVLSREDLLYVLSIVNHVNYSN